MAEASSSSHSHSKMTTPVPGPSAAPAAAASEGKKKPSMEGMSVPTKAANNIQPNMSVMNSPLIGHEKVEQFYTIDQIKSLLYCCCVFESMRAESGQKYSTDELAAISDAEDFFSTCMVKKLLKQVPKFPKAQYVCTCCNYHLDNIATVCTHLGNERHGKNERLAQEGILLSMAPPLSETHYKTLSNLVLKTYQDVGLHGDDQIRRAEILNRLQRDFQSAEFCYGLELFGSSVFGFGFVDSDVNLNLTVPGCIGQSVGPGLCEHLSNLLKSLPYCRDVTEKWTSKWTIIRFTDNISGKICTVHFNNDDGMACTKLFQEYDKVDPRVRPLVVAFRQFARVIEVNNPEEGTLPGIALTIMVLDFLQEKKILPLLHDPRTARNPDPDFKTLGDFGPHQADTSESLGQLWVGLLLYYSTFATRDKVVTISQPPPSRKSDKAWNRKLSIEDPIVPQANLSRCLSNNKICDYILDRIKSAYVYFTIPRDKTGPLYDWILEGKPSRLTGKTYYYNRANPATLSLQDIIRQMQKVKILETSTAPESDMSKARLVNLYFGNMARKICVLADDVHLMSNVLLSDEYYYEISQVLQNGEKPPKFCKSCSSDGHLKKDCPEEALPKMKRLIHGPTPYSLKALDWAMQRNYVMEAINDKDIRLRKTITAEIYSALQSVYPDVELTMFGSTFNGFGLHQSDIDICLRLTSIQLTKADRQVEEVNNVLKTIVSQLKSIGCMQEILAIPSAKVPIVKFRHRFSRLEGDISLCNTLALHNTKMLRLYTDIDERLKTMGCFLKRLTKLCDINAASKGSLSSYGYVLMVIHFLQQHNPPVLPVLQELPEGFKPTNIVDGWNAYFFSDIQELPKVWPHYGKNKQTASELWTAFLKYYAEEFQFDEQVITISQLEPMLRLSKSWMGESVIAIEDPFELTHNLGAGLSRRMGVHIVKAIQRFREVFTYPADNAGKVDWLAWYMDPRRIRGNSNPPVDRQCRICNRIGHFARNCASTNEDKTFSYKDSETPTYPNMTRPPGPGPRYPNTLVIHNQNFLKINTALDGDANSSDSIQSPVESNNFGAISSTIEKEPFLPTTPLTAFPLKDESSEHIKSETAQETNRGHVPLSNNCFPRNNDIQFFDSCNLSQDSEAAIEAMISRNPGVVFELQGHGESENINQLMQTASTVSPEKIELGLPRSFISAPDLHPFPLARSYNSGIILHPQIIIPSLPPPPGFIPKVGPLHGVDPRMQNGFAYTDLSLQHANNVGHRPVEPVRGDAFNKMFGESAPCPPPPGFDSLPNAVVRKVGPIYPEQPIGAANNFQPTLNNQISHIMPNLNSDLESSSLPSAVPISVLESRFHGSVQGQDQGLAAIRGDPFSSAIEVSELERKLRSSEDDLNYGVPADRENISGGMLNGQMSPGRYSPIFSHALYPGGNIFNRPTVDSIPISTFYNPFSGPADLVANKSPMMVMRATGDNGVNYNEVKGGTTTHSYLLSHVHHGPVVSAVPAQTGTCSPQLQHFAPQFHYPYGYPVNPAQLPINFQQQLPNQGYHPFPSAANPGVMSQFHFEGNDG